MERSTQPFHQSIVGNINEATSAAELMVLERVILTTDIPKDHDIIRAAWEAKFAELGLKGIRRVVESLEARKPVLVAA